MRKSRRAATLATMMTLLIFTAEGMVAPHVYSIVQGPLREFSADAHRILGKQGTLVVYGLNAPSIVFYANHSVSSFGVGPDGEDRIRNLLEAGRPLVVITRIAHARQLDAVPGLYRMKARDGYAMYSSLRYSAETFSNFKLTTDNRATASDDRLSVVGCPFFIEAV